MPRPRAPATSSARCADSCKAVASRWRPRAARKHRLLVDRTGDPLEGVRHAAARRARSTADFALGDGRRGRGRCTCARRSFRKGAARDAAVDGDHHASKRAITHRRCANPRARRDARRGRRRWSAGRRCATPSFGKKVSALERSPRSPRPSTTRVPPTMSPPIACLSAARPRAADLAQPLMPLADIRNVPPLLAAASAVSMLARRGSSSRPSLARSSSPVVVDGNVAVSSTPAAAASQRDVAVLAHVHGAIERRLHDVLDMNEDRGHR